MKTILTLFCALLMAFTAMAQIAPVTSIGTIEATYPGQTITIPIHVTDFTNVDAISLSLKYDNRLLQFVDFTLTSDIFIQAVDNPGGADNIGRLRMGGNYYSSPVSFSGGIIAMVTMRWLGKNHALLDWEDNTQACEWSTPSGTLSQSAKNYIDGKVHASVMIGGMKWSLYNLNDGIKSASQLNNDVVEKFCYGGKDVNCDVYGGLYQWAEAVQYYKGVTNTTHWNPLPQGYIQGICPDGWHIPSIEEFQSLINELGGSAVAGGKIKETGTSHWGKRLFPQNIGATNSSGFTSLPSGTALGGKYGYMHEYGHMWTITKGQRSDAAHWYSATFATTNMVTGQSDKISAMSVRCVANSSTLNPSTVISPEGYGIFPALIAPSLTFKSQTFVVPITVKNFNNVSSGEIYFDYNPNIVSVAAINVEASAPGMSAMVDVSSAMVKISCTNPVSFIDGTVLFTITFSKKTSGVSVIAFEPTTMWNGQKVPETNFINGSVNILQ